MPNIISKILHRKSKSSSSAGTSPSPASKSTPNLSRSTQTPSQSPTTPAKSRHTPPTTVGSRSARNLVNSPGPDVAAQSKDLPDIPSFAAVQASSRNQQRLNQSPNSSRVLPTKFASPVGQDEEDVVVIDKSSDPRLPEETSLEKRPLDEMVRKTSGQIGRSREDGGAFGRGHQTESFDPHSSTEASFETRGPEGLSEKSLNQTLQPIESGGDLKKGKTTRSLQGAENTQKISEFPSPPERPENISRLNGGEANQGKNKCILFGILRS